MITHTHIVYPPAEVLVRQSTQDEAGHTYLDVVDGTFDTLTLSDATGHLAPLLRTWADQVDLAEQGTLTAVTVPVDLLIFLAAPPSGQHPADVTVRKAISRLRTVGVPDSTIAVIERTVLAPAEVTA